MNANETVDRFITMADVCHRTSLSSRMIYNYIDRGTLKPIKLGGKTLFCETEVIEWMESLKQARGK